MRNTSSIALFAGIIFIFFAVFVARAGTQLALQKYPDYPESKISILYENKIVDSILQYKEFITNKKPELKNKKFINSFNCDFDSDGTNELLLAYGNEVKIDNADAIDYCCILKNTGSGIRLVCEWSGDNGSVYYTYAIKPVKLKDSNKVYLYLNITNGISEQGFELLEIDNNDLKSIERVDHNATGTGKAELIDRDNDGYFDGYKRIDYNNYTLGYDIVSFYNYDYNNNEFIPEHTEISNYDEEPLTAEQTVLQYMKIQMLDQQYDFTNSAGYLKSMIHSSRYNEVRKIKIAREVWYEPLQSDEINITSKEGNNKSTVTAKYHNTPHEYKLDFDLIKVDDKWEIRNISM